MIREGTIDNISSSSTLIAKIRDYVQLMKPNLSTMVVFSSVIGYLLAPGISFHWLDVILLFLGGMLVTNAANIINQIIERVSDGFMKRTMNRPLPTHRMSVTEAVIICILSALIGSFLLGFFFNWLAAGLSILSMLLYGFAYTPMKKVNTIATFIGAIPGAFPPLIGWVAALGMAGLGGTNDLVGLGGWVLFLIQFFWQFPHFWAIAWLGYEEYLKAGIMLLPSKNGKTSFTGLQCLFYSLPLLPLSMVPHYLGMTGTVSMYVCLLFAAYYVFNSALFYTKNDRFSAKKVMYSSFIYLPGVLIALIIDKI